MTKEQLISALAKIQLEDGNMDALLNSNLLSDKAVLKPLDAIAMESARELYSDALLERLNSNMQAVMPCAMEFRGYDTNYLAGLLSAHNQGGMLRIWPKPAAYVGWNSGNNNALGGTSIYLNYILTCRERPISRWS